MLAWDEQKEAGTEAMIDAPLHFSGRLKKFIGMSNLKRAALNVIANQLTEADIGETIRT